MGLMGYAARRNISRALDPAKLMGRSTPEQIERFEKMQTQLKENREEKEREKNIHYFNFKKLVNSLVDTTQINIKNVSKFNTELRKTISLDAEGDAAFSQFIEIFPPHLANIKKISNLLSKNKEFNEKKINSAKESVTILIKSLPKMTKILKKEMVFSEKLLKQFTKRHGFLYKIEPIAVQERKIIENLENFKKIYLEHKGNAIEKAKAFKGNSDKNSQQVVSEGIRHMDRLHDLFSSEVSNFIKSNIGGNENISLEKYLFEKRKKFFRNERIQVVTLSRLLKIQKDLINSFSPNRRSSFSSYSKKLSENLEKVIEVFNILKSFYDGLNQS